MKYDIRFLQIVFWETCENAPMLIAFLLAAHTQAQNLILAVCILVLGTACGAALIHFTESKKYSNHPSLKETLVNFIVFTISAFPFIFYVSNNNVWWSNWATDLVLGALIGIAISYGESRGWSSTATAKVHAVSMATSVVLFLYAIRLTYSLELISAIFLVGVVFNFLVSIVIVLFDYWPIKQPDDKLVASPK